MIRASALPVAPRVLAWPVAPDLQQARRNSRRGCRRDGRRSEFDPNSDPNRSPKLPQQQRACHFGIRRFCGQKITLHHQAARREHSARHLLIWRFQVRFRGGSPISSKKTSTHGQRLRAERPFDTLTDTLRKLPRQVDTAKGDCTGGFSLGKNVRGGTRPRLSCGRSWL